ncbi:MAG: transposase [Actinomycetota bacterium]
MRRYAAITESMDLPAWLRQQLAEEGSDLLRETVCSLAEALMGAEADAVCDAPFEVVSMERTNRGNGYRERRWDTRVGSIGLRSRAGSSAA